MPESSNTSQAKQTVNYSIGVVARLTGLSTHTLRMWERRYGLGSTHRTEKGQRQYTSVDLDHLKLVKLLIDDGMRIGDIAKLPKKTLSALQMQSHGAASEYSSPETAQTLVSGNKLIQFFRLHGKRYPQLNIDTILESPEASLVENLKHYDASILFLELARISKTDIKTLKKLADQGKTINIHCAKVEQSALNALESMGVKLFQGSINTEQLDSLVNKALAQQITRTLLEQSTDKYEVDIPQKQQRHFSQSDLDKAAKMTSKLDCECPAHLSAIISSLNAFEEYSQQCGADNWEQAATHACIYAYTSQARQLMEKALLAAVHEQTL